LDVGDGLAGIGRRNGVAHSNKLTLDVTVRKRLPKLFVDTRVRINELDCAVLPNAHNGHIVAPQWPFGRRFQLR
jgi:hypothetical protein